MGGDRAKTLKQLAGHLDLSIATVSRALAGQERIALKTRRRVADAAREMGYVANRAARQLVSGRSHFVCLLTPVRGPDFINSYLGEFVIGLGEGLVAHGLDLFLATVQQGRDDLEILRHVVVSGRADGVVVPRVEEQDARLAYLAMHGFPAVAHGQLLDAGFGYHWLDSDGETAFGQALELLVNLGHRHIGLVTITDPMTFRHHREAGLRKALQRRGGVRLSVETSQRFDPDARIAAVRRMLGRPDRPTAIIGLFDEIALTVLEEAVRAGLAVPRDLSVIGFDNIPSASYAPPGLTTFDAKVRDAARAIADMLVRVIADPGAEPQGRLVPPKLVLRGSHGPAPGVT